MISTEKLQELYNTELQHDLASIESLRKKIHGDFLFAIIGIVISIVIYNVWKLYLTNLGYICTALFIFCILMIINSFANAFKYTTEFKKTIVEKIIKLINPEWEYFPEESISEFDVIDSNMFDVEHSEFEGEDLIKGTINGNTFQLSEIKTKYTFIGETFDGDPIEKTKPLFEGIFAHIEMNKSREGYLKVDAFSKDNDIRRDQYIETKDSRTKTGDKSFDDNFIVHTSNDSLINHIVTPSLKKALIEIQEAYNTIITIVYAESDTYIGICMEEDLFEPNIWNSGVKFEEIEQMNKQFNFIETIISELK